VNQAPGRKHLLLLAVLILIQVGQPLLEHRSAVTKVLSDTVFVAICLYVFYIVCNERWQRILGLALFLLVLAGNLGLYTHGRAIQRASAILFHCALIAFLGFAVTVILRDLFGKTMIQGDDVIGAICGYILGGMVWGNLYALAYLFIPDTFSVNPAMRCGSTIGSSGAPCSTT